MPGVDYGTIDTCIAFLLKYMSDCRSLGVGEKPDRPDMDIGDVNSKFYATAPWSGMVNDRF